MLSNMPGKSLSSEHLMQRKKSNKKYLWDLALNCPESHNPEEQVKKFPMRPCLCPSYSQAL